MRLWQAFLVILAGLSLILAACDVSNYAFRVDESLQIVAPDARTTVELPVTIRWVDDAAPDEARVDPDDPDAGYYAVFLDRAPLGPGKILADVVKDPELCRQDPDCPSEAMLRDRGVILTADTEVTVEFLPDRRPSRRATAKDPHEVTIVRMRGNERVGEAAWDLSFFVRR